MALVRESSAMPTAAQIAERAGYSVRSIFERFPDLHRAARRRHRLRDRRGRGAGALRDLDADRATRIRSPGRPARARLRALAAAVARAVDRCLESPDLHQRIGMIRQLIVMRMEMMFRPELSTVVTTCARRPCWRSKSLLDFESWARMRELYGLSFEEASAVWMKAIDRLLPPTPALSIEQQPPTPIVDGRRLRSERTRQLIIEAYLALLRDSPKIPTSNADCRARRLLRALGVRAFPRPVVAAHRRDRPCLRARARRRR